jgi:hypothetical protein
MLAQQSNIAPIPILAPRVHDDRDMFTSGRDMAADRLQ